MRVWFTWLLVVFGFLGAMALADCVDRTSSVSPLGLFDGSIYHDTGAFNAYHGGIRTWAAREDSEIILGGLWGRCPVSVGLTVTPTVQSQRVLVLSNGSVVQELDVTGTQVVLLKARSDEEGFLRLRLARSGLVDGDEGARFEIRVGRIEIRQEGPPAIPVHRWVEYLLLVSIVSGLVWTGWCGMGRMIVSGLAGALFMTALLASRVRLLGSLPWVLFILGSALALVGLCHLALRMPRPCARWVAAAAVLKLVFCVQPNFPYGDSLEHIHKASAVRHGELITNTAPGPVSRMRVPYPPAFHVILGMLIDWSARDVEAVPTVLVAIALLEGTAPALLFGLMRAGGASAPAAGSAAVAYAVMPEGILVVAKAIGANVFGGWVGLACIWAAIRVVRSSRSSIRTSESGVLVLLFALAALSHVGAGTTVASLVILWMGYGVFRREIPWQRAASVLVAGAGASALAWLVYYRETAAALGGVLSATHGAIATSPQGFFAVRWVRLGKILQDLVLKFGGLPPVLAALGIVRGELPAPLGSLLYSWLATGSCFGALAVLTPFPLRFEYFLMPAVAMATGLAVEGLHGRVRHVAPLTWSLTLAVQLGIAWFLALGRFRMLSVMGASEKWPFPFDLH